MRIAELPLQSARRRVTRACVSYPTALCEDVNTEFGGLPRGRAGDGVRGRMVRGGGDDGRRLPF